MVLATTIPILMRSVLPTFHFHVLAEPGLGMLISCSISACDFVLDLKGDGWMDGFCNLWSHSMTILQ